MEPYEEELLEPLKYFKELEFNLEQNAEALFDELTKKSGIDTDENIKTCEEYYDLLDIAKTFDKKLQNHRGLRAFLIVMTILLFVVGTILIVAAIMNKDLLPALLPSGIAGILLGVGCIILVVKIVNKAVKKYAAKAEELHQKANIKRNIAEEQMVPLNALYDWNMTSSLISKTAPIIHMDKNFTVERCSHLSANYGWKMSNPDNVSTVFAQSGTIVGNPFVYERDFAQEMFQKTYTGTLVIHWTTTVSNGKGGTRVVSHTQTLVATVSKPAAKFYLDTALIYGNEAAPKLSFSRLKGNANELSEAKLNKNVEAFEKKLAKKQEKATSSSFTALGNTKFEYLFNALDRDNEVEFRLLFTPLAQKNMIALLTSKKPYGDDFRFIKRKMINLIHSDHAQTLDYDGNPIHFYNFDYNKARKNFVNYNMNAFQGIFYDFVPLLSIPLYQQHKDYAPEYDKEYKGSVTEYEAEVLVNFMSVDLFKPEDCDTNVILKAKLLQCNRDVNIFEITSHGFHMDPRVDLIPKVGGDGRTHMVPVHWYEYIPVEAKGATVVINVGGTKQQYDAIKDRISELVSNYSMSSDIIYQRGLLSFPLKEGVTSINANEIIKLFSQKED